jgi:hypothetical protein
MAGSTPTPSCAQKGTLEMRSRLAVGAIAATIGLATAAVAQTTSPCTSTRTGDFYRTDCQAQGPKSNSIFEHCRLIDSKPTTADPSIRQKPYGNWNSNFGGLGPGQAK